MGNHVFSVKYPDSLVGMWKYMNCQPVGGDKEPMSENDVVKAWGDFRLTVMPEAAEMSRKFCRSTADDAASDFLVALVGGPCPSEITTAGTLKKRAKKFFAEKWNPCGKEVYDAVAEALRKLMKNGILQRSEPDKNIGNSTRFWISGSTPTQIATPEECERQFPRIPRVGIRNRGAPGKQGIIGEHKALLTPTDATKIVLGLFGLMGNSAKICMQELVACALNRTRNVIVPFVESYDETDKDDQGDGVKTDAAVSSAMEEGASNTSEADASQTDRHEHEEGTLSAMSAKNLAERLKRGLVSDDEDVQDSDGNVADESLESEETIDEQRYRRDMLEILSRAAANRIWTRVLASSSDKVFCLYSLPKFSGVEFDTKLKDLGPTSTVGAKHVKMQDVLKEELLFIIKQPDRFRFGPDNAMRRIRLKLIGRCAEKGHEVPL